MEFSEKIFTVEGFNAPPNEHTPIYSWVWNAQITREETDKQLLEMQRLGIKAFYIIPEPKLFRPVRIPTELEPDYLTDAFMKEVRYALEKAEKMGMKCWIYDEGGWPSGGAGGKVLKKHPEYARRTPCCTETEFKAGSIYTKSRSDIIAAFINHDVMIEEGYKFSNDTAVDEYYSKTELFLEPGVADFPDLSLSEATDCFIEMTHEKYAEYLSDYFGNHIGAVFTDEPTLPRPFPLHERIIDAYEKVYGESPLSCLPALCGKVEPDEKTAEMRIKWYDLCSRFFCENFLTRCKKWANSHHMDFVGHMDKDNTAMGSLYGGSMHLLRSLRQLDIPGVDVIWRHIFPGEPGVTCAKGDEDPSNGFFPRYASSAAAQIGSNAAMSESLGVYGAGITYEQMRFVFGFQAIRGINVFNLMLLAYGRSGYMLAGELPSFREDYACFGDLADWNLYLERLSYVSSVGKRVCNTALYYPIRDIWSGVNSIAVADAYEEIGLKLEAKQIDFDIIDDDILENATGLENGSICFGNVCYKQIVLPPCKYLSEKSKANLEIFKANGGRIFEGDTEIVRPAVITGNSCGLQMMHRKAENQDIYCLFNSNTEPSEFVFDFGGRMGFYINITEGKTEPLNMLNDLVKVTLQCGESGAICITKDIPELCEVISPKRSMEIGNFKFRRIKSLEIGELQAINHDIDEESVMITTGDWSEVAGKEFSGTALYETTFTLPDGEYDSLILDLGNVCYTCEVILNGKSLGKKLMSPYKYTISKELLMTENNLCIKVKNTAGNQFFYTNSFDKWPEWMLTPYFEKEKTFDKETLASGLYGSVRILY